MELQPEQAEPSTIYGFCEALLSELGARVERVLIDTSEEKGFRAVIHLRRGPLIATWPSELADALALALRVGAPLYITEQVFERHGSDLGLSHLFWEPGEARRWLDRLKPEDFTA